MSIKPIEALPPERESVTRRKMLRDDIMSAISQRITAFEFEGLKVLLDKKSIYVVNEGKLEEKYKVQEFMRHPNRTFKRLMKYREMMKGGE